MSTDEVNQILVRLAAFEATVTAQLAGIATDNARGEGVHQDHEQRIRDLEAGRSEGKGVWKVLTAGGVAGGGLVAIAAAVLRSLGA